MGDTEDAYCRRCGRITTFSIQGNFATCLSCGNSHYISAEISNRGTVDGYCSSCGRVTTWIRDTPYTTCLSCGKSHYVGH